MKKVSPHLLLALALAWLAGCSAASSDTGSVQFAVSLPQPLASSISRVTVTAAARSRGLYRIIFQISASEAPLVDSLASTL